MHFPPPQAPQSRGNRAVLVLVGGLVLVLGLLLIIDRVADGYAERRIGSDLQSALALDAAPAVEIHGFPFLTQLAGEELDEVQIKIPKVVAEDTKLPLRDLNISLRQVKASDWYHRFVATDVRGQGRIDYSDLTKFAGGKVSGTEDGLIKITFETTIRSINLKAVVTGRPSLNQKAQTVTVVDPTIELDGVKVPDGPAELLLPRLLQPIHISDLPLGLRLSSVEARPEGLIGRVAGRDVPVLER